MLVHGTGDGGQFVLGVDVSNIQRPRLHVAVKELVNSGKMGPAGVERVVAAGMHSLVLDSNGQVSAALICCPLVWHRLRPRRHLR